MRLSFSPQSPSGKLRGKGEHPGSTPSKTAAGTGVNTESSPSLTFFTLNFGTMKRLGVFLTSAIVSGRTNTIVSALCHLSDIQSTISKTLLGAFRETCGSRGSEGLEGFD